MLVLELHSSNGHVESLETHAKTPRHQKAWYLCSRMLSGTPSELRYDLMRIRQGDPAWGCPDSATATSRPEQDDLFALRKCQACLHHCVESNQLKQKAARLLQKNPLRRVAQMLHSQRGFALYAGVHGHSDLIVHRFLIIHIVKKSMTAPSCMCLVAQLVLAAVGVSTCFVLACTLKQKHMQECVCASHGTTAENRSNFLHVVISRFFHSLSLSVRSSLPLSPSPLSFSLSLSVSFSLSLSVSPCTLNALCIDVLSVGVSKVHIS